MGEVKVSAMQQTARNDALYNWLTNQMCLSPTAVYPLAGDASLRRYFRVIIDKTNYVVMDAPINSENCRPFVAIAKTLSALGLRVPTIYETDFEQGFLLLEDFGDKQYLQALNSESAETLYNNALQQLALLQTCQSVTDYQLPSFDYKTYMMEFSHFEKWYLTQYLGLTLTATEQQMLQATYEFLIASAQLQPQVFVHRDYHSRNLMCLADGEVGILDFQDALWGPITYDVMSLLKDCYIHWPQSRIEKWLKQFYQQCSQRKIKLPEFAEFCRWFDFMSIQRHLKVLYIFSRLQLFYNNPNFIQYIPRVLAYLLRTLPRYPELRELQLFIKKRVLPNESDVTCRRAGEAFGQINC